MSKDKELETLQAMYERAVALHEQGDPATACTIYEQVVEQVPDADVVFYNLGVARYALGDFQEAERALLDAVAINEAEVDYWFNLALTRKAMQRFAEAVGSYKQALAIRPDDIEILYSLGCCCKDCGAFDEAVHVYRHLLEIDNQYVPAINNLAYLLHLKGELREAGELYKRVLVLQPDHPGAAFMAKALSGEGASAPPPEYVRDLFDQFAGTFDQHLLDKLEYQVPSLLADMLKNNPGREVYNHCIDLGCGTGLCGELIRDRTQVLTGIDLSANMVERAAEKGIYDSLEEAELITYLRTTDHSFDLLLAADVFTYLGDLVPVFQAMASRCQPGAHLLFSVESVDGNDWVLKSTGRYGHGHAYVLEVARKCGFSLLDCKPSQLRKERGEWIKGAVYFFCVST